MSYSIVYDRCFLKTNTGIIPLFFHGCNNCEQEYRGRFILERNWSCFQREWVNLPADELMKAVRKAYSPNPEEEAWKQNGKWVKRGDVPKAFETGIKKAVTLEAVIEKYPQQKLKCYVEWWVKGDKGGEEAYADKPQYLKTTQELEDWLAYANDRLAKLKDEGVSPSGIYFCTEFDGVKPLRMGTTFTTEKKYPDGYYIQNGKNGYVTNIEYRDDGEISSCSYALNPNAAMLFTDPGLIGKLTNTFKSKNQKIAPAVVERKKNSQYVIKNVTRSYYGPPIYVLKKTRSRLHHTYEAQNAMKFFTEAEANKYIQKLKESFLSAEFEVCKTSAEA